jgi:hypothetical protein
LNRLNSEEVAFWIKELSGVMASDDGDRVAKAYQRNVIV